MKLRWFRPFVVLTAALIVSISNIISKRPVLESLIWLLIVILVFFIIGSIGTKVIVRAMSAKPKEEDDLMIPFEDEEEEADETQETEQEKESVTS